MTQLNKARAKIRDEGWKLGFKHVYEEGYEKARGEYEVWYYCSVCGKPITIMPNSESHKALIRYMRDHGWGHRACHEKAEARP